MFHQRTIILALFLSVGLLHWGCGQKSADLQEDAVAPDKTLYENGMEFLRKNQFIKSRLSLQTLINTYPDSEYTPSAYLAIADSYYREGGTEGLLQAESQYKDFIIYFPTHEMADDAQLRVSAALFKLMNEPDRDATYTRKTAQELKRFLKNYPDSEYTETVREALREVEENQAIGVKGIASFYDKRGKYEAAGNRYKQVMEEFPEFSQLDQVLYRLGETMLKLDRAEEASVYFSMVAIGFPFSKHFGTCKDRLAMLEKPIPEVDPAQAERRRANLPVDDGGSMLNPMNLIREIFSGRKDLYEVARKRVEQRRMLEAQAQQGASENPDSKGGNQ